MRTVVITGSTSGFGLLLVEEFLKQGDTVIATGRRLKERSELARFRGPRLIEAELDVTSDAQREAFVATLSKVDVLINNAGYGLFGALEDCSIEQIRHQMEVCFFGTALLTRAILPFLRESRGRVFNFSSILGVNAMPLSGVYSASKFAVEGLSESLYHELSPLGVQVCLVEPGAFRTNFSQNVQWGSSAQSERSPYFKRSRSFEALFERLSARPNPTDPAVVSRGVYKLSRQRRMPLRAEFGRDAKATLLMRKLIPQGLYQSGARRMFERMIPS